MKGLAVARSKSTSRDESFRWDFALLREDGENRSTSVEVLACRSGSALICAGRRMTLGDDLVEMMECDERPLLTVQDDGVALLMPQYRRSADVILCCRVACAHDVAARVIRQGSLPRQYRIHGMPPEISDGGSGSEDETVYRLLADMVNAEETLRMDALFHGTASRMLTVGEIGRAVECFADLVGCEVQLDFPIPIGEAMCYQTAATDVVLLYGLLLVRQYAATRIGVCHVRTMGGIDGGRLIIELEMTLYQDEDRPEDNPAWHCLKSCAEENGMELAAERSDGVWRMTLTCLCDPARELSGDLKAEAELLS